ncbi:stage II sporulation protein D [Paenibacillus endophyticus]|uniref:Stage II sporulation protein D n=1 Tax=Paenibacillus endophyticus TaxID=1294268 RepID=A0A7W5CBD7_9BACL|nr:stage II sporulation protein D [Paenibacillus endophyticus]MBB3154596.1 stage II sporulation protein D [Paenibacillus endophyticus]
MKRRIGRISIVSAVDRLRTSSWLALFAIGAMLGASVLLIRLSLLELQDARAAPGMQAAAVQQGSKTELPAPGPLEADGSRFPSNEVKSQKPTLSADSNARTEDPSTLDGLVVHVYLAKEKRVENVPLETYVRGVVAAEMPIEFELEALKAQAIAARTYIMRRMVHGDNSGVPAKGADVTDTTDHQVYVSLAELAQKWPEADLKKHMQKLNSVIAQTRGKVITYKGDPIDAAFFSTSNGYTENSEDYWNQEIPYLRSVASPWDETISPRYKETVNLTLDDFFRKLGISKKSSAKSDIRIVEKTAGKRISKIVIGGTTFTGREVREKLGLASSQFTWRMEDGSIAITTYGYGHGVGMSQWGANGMAKAGASDDEIVAHYYSSVQVEQVTKFSEILAGRF